MSILTHFDSVHAKQGMSFSAKNHYGFAGKLHTAIQQNFHGMGVLKNNTAVVASLNAQVLKQQHLIRTGGLTKFQVEKMIAKVHHEAAMKGGHLGAIEKEALHKLGHHLTKQIIKHAPTPNDQAHHGITSIQNTQHTASASRIGDQTKITSSGNISHASGGIANSIRQKNNPLTSNLSNTKPNAPLNIKLSI